MDNSVPVPSNVTRIPPTKSLYYKTLLSHFFYCNYFTIFTSKNGVFWLAEHKVDICE